MNGLGGWLALAAAAAVTEAATDRPRAKQTDGLVALVPRAEAGSGSH